VIKPVVVAAVVAAAVAALSRRRQAQTESSRLWHEATADASR
jgi:hypothetical protein